MGKSKYQADNDIIHPIRLGKAALAVANNTAPEGAVTSPIPAKVSKTNRQIGLRPRFVRLSRETAVAGEERKLITYVNLPILTKAAFSAPAFADQSAVTYAGKEYKVIQREAEDY